MYLTDKLIDINPLLPNVQNNARVAKISIL